MGGDKKSGRKLNLLESEIEKRKHHEGKFSMLPRETTHLKEHQWL
jgi:hypothetical protein